MVHGRSPLGMLRALRASVFVLPILATLVMAPFTLGPGATGTPLNPQSRTELAPLLVPLMLALAITTIVARLTLAPASAKPLRVLAICIVYPLAIANTMAATISWLSGGSGAWVAAAFAAAVVAVTAVSLGRLAHDVSPRWG